MKKLFKFILPIAILAVVLVACAGCGEQKTNLEKLVDRTSYMQEGLYTAADDNFDVTLSVINQEEHFIADGKVGGIMLLSTLTLTPHSTDSLSKTYEYTLTGDVSSVSGTVSKSRLGINLACKITDISSVGKIQSLTLKEGETSIEYQLTDICPAEFGAQNALEVAYTHFQQKIDPALDDNSFDRECYVKLLGQGEKDGKYYWYVSFIKDKGDYWAAVIDPETKAVVSARESK
ncbi:MAG: hypothetical protein HFE33_01010 [Clostridia bacterium]|jgi:hypothetical protein|nr:hypothetical protein [Clostridia bacterium]MCI9290448.1 hypothetical protein [Clostridia bacterium]MDE6884282.1 hypothetical protein [Clostridia bacterium]